MTERVEYDEFGLFHENAAEYGLPFDRPPVVRRAFADVGVGGERSLTDGASVSVCPNLGECCSTPTT